MRLKYLLFLNIIIFSTSCITVNRFSSIVREKLQKDNQYVIEKNENIIVKADSLINQDSIVIVNKMKSLFIPALIYWHLDYYLGCSINPNFLAKKIENEMIKSFNKIGISETIGNKKIEIYLIQVPSNFMYVHKERIVFLLFGYAGQSIESIYPGNNILKIRYNLFDNNIIVKTGELAESSSNLPTNNVGKSTKKFTLNFMDLFEKENDLLSQKLAYKLKKELE